MIKHIATMLFYPDFAPIWDYGPDFKNPRGKKWFWAKITFLGFYVFSKGVKDLKKLCFFKLVKNGFFPIGHFHPYT